MSDLIANVIGWGSVLVLVCMWKYADHLGDGNIERIDDDKERTRRNAVFGEKKPQNVGDSLRTELHILADLRGCDD